MPTVDRKQQVADVLMDAPLLVRVFVCLSVFLSKQ